MTNSVRRILLIEDKISDARLIRAMLSHSDNDWKYALTVADRLSSGLELLKEGTFDVVLLDMGLPDSSGVDTLRKVYNMKPDLPVIVLTGRSDRELALEAIGLGAQDYLLKGQIDSDTLLRSLRHAIERKRADTAFRNSEILLKTIIETEPECVKLLDADANLLMMNRAGLDMIQVDSFDQVKGRCVCPLIVPEDCDSFMELTRRVFKGESGSLVFRMTGARGRQLWLETHAVPFRNEKDEIVALLGITRDITERKHAEEELSRSYNLTKTIIDSMSEVISLIDVIDFRIVGVNSAFLREYGYKDESEVVGKTCYEITHHRSDACAPPDDICPLGETVKKGENVTAEHVHYDKQGEKIYAEVSTSPIKDENGNIIQVVHVQRNITERKIMEEKIRHQAYHDALTDLPNRRFFMDIAHLELAQARRNSKKAAILFIDLDRFKEINDVMGHETGDALLKDVAARLKSQVRETDTVARTGGDEFNILLSDITNPEDIVPVAKEITDSLRKPFTIAGQEFQTGASIGISLYPDDANELATLLRYADIALYYAKEQGRNNFQFYNPAINVRSVERLMLEGRMQQMIGQGELEAYYQPLVDMKTGKIMNVEALVRWRHPELGLLEPKDFLSCAEETGLITAIDRWVLRTACLQAKAWLDSGLSSTGVAVNLSARHFQDMELVKKISEILNETGLPPQYLEVEITETIAMSNIERTIAHLNELAAIGVHISIDDFGTGYSSLNYLKQLPIQKLKIDQSFIRDIATNSDDRAIISAVTAMAHAMRIKVLAEGVETEDQLSFLRATQCDEAQGYLFSKPLPAEGFRELMASER